MVPISPAVCDHMTVMDVGVTCATMGEGVDGTGGGREGEGNGYVP